MKGILLINLGSPKDLEDESIKEYLKEFLSDDLVVDYPKQIQQILVNWIIVPNRYKKTQGIRIRTPLAIERQQRLLVW